MSATKRGRRNENILVGIDILILLGVLWLPTAKLRCSQQIYTCFLPVSSSEKLGISALSSLIHMGWCLPQTSWLCTLFSYSQSRPAVLCSHSSLLIPSSLRYPWRGASRTHRFFLTPKSKSPAAEFQPGFLSRNTFSPLNIILVPAASCVLEINMVAFTYVPLLTRWDNGIFHLFNKVGYLTSQN